jgi:hypothetical protein
VMRRYVYHPTRKIIGLLWDGPTLDEQIYLHVLSASRSIANRTSAHWSRGDLSARNIAAIFMTVWLWRFLILVRVRILQLPAVEPIRTGVRCHASKASTLRLTTIIYCANLARCPFWYLNVSPALLYMYPNQKSKGFVCDLESRHTNKHLESGLAVESLFPHSHDNTSAKALSLPMNDAIQSS